MQAKFEVPSLGWPARLADKLMIPVMYLVSGTLNEKPQKTHRWNNKKLTKAEVGSLNQEEMAHCRGVSYANKRHLLRFHIPIFGGWQSYVVLEPEHPQGWHVGWIPQDTAAGVSRIQLSGPVRLLLGPDEVSFFGISASRRNP